MRGSRASAASTSAGPGGSSTPSRSLFCKIYGSTPNSAHALYTLLCEERAIATFPPCLRTAYSMA